MKKNQKRKVPILNYSISSFSDYDKLTRSNETKKKIFDNLILAVKDALDNKKSSIDIFKLQDTDYSISLNKEQWKSSIQKAIEFYSSSEIEDYEKCLECNKLIESIN